MRTVLAATLMALFICGSPTLNGAAETDQDPAGVATGGAPDGDVAPPAMDGGQDGAGDYQADSPNDLMKDFTRHRPGACPEGPPCKTEDEEGD